MREAHVEIGPLTSRAWEANATSGAPASSPTSWSASSPSPASSSNTQIPLCLWFLAKTKNADAKRGERTSLDNELALAASTNPLPSWTLNGEIEVPHFAASSNRIYNN